MSSTMPESATRRGLGESPADGCAGPSADASDFSSFSRATNWCLRERAGGAKTLATDIRSLGTYQRHLTLESYTRFFFLLCKSRRIIDINFCLLHRPLGSR